MVEIDGIYFGMIQKSYMCTNSQQVLPLSVIFFPVLNPHIWYGGLMSGCTDDLTIQSHVDCAKYQLHQFFLENYAKATSPLSTIQPVFTDISGSLQRVNFTAQYKKHPLSLRDELEEFYTLPPEYFDPCDPIQWWSGHCSQFLNMSHLAQIVLAIPGEFTLTPLNVATKYLAILLWFSCCS